MGTQSSTIQMNLIDGVTGPANNVKNSMKGMVDAMPGGLAGRGDFTKGFLGTTIGQLGTLATAYKLAQFAKQGFMDKAREDAAFERTRQRLRANAQDLRRAREEIDAIAKQFGVANDEVIKGFDEMATGGRKMADVVKELKMAVQASSAYQMSIAEAGKMTRVFTDQLKIPVADVEKAWDMMAAAAQRGSIDVKTLATELPKMGTAAELAGFKGEEGLRRLLAVVEAIAPKFASGADAMAAMDDMLAKLRSSKIVAAFKKQNVDLLREYDRGAKAGKDMLNTFYNLVMKLTGGDLSKATTMFGQSAGEIVKVLEGMKDNAQKIKDVYAGIADATGETAERAKLNADTQQAQIERLGNAWDDLRKTFGSELPLALFGGLDGAASKIETVTNGFKGLIVTINEIYRLFGVKGGLDVQMTHAQQELKRAKEMPYSLVDRLKGREQFDKDKAALIEEWQGEVDRLQKLMDTEGKTPLPTPRPPGLGLEPAGPPKPEPPASFRERFSFPTIDAPKQAYEQAGVELGQAVIGALKRAIASGIFDVRSQIEGGLSGITVSPTIKVNPQVGGALNADNVSKAQ